MIVGEGKEEKKRFGGQNHTLVSHVMKPASIRVLHFDMVEPQSKQTATNESVTRNLRVPPSSSSFDDFLFFWARVSVFLQNEYKQLPYVGQEVKNKTAPCI